MTDSQPSGPSQPNTLGNISLGLGVASAALVFGIGFCALVGAQQGWVTIAGTPLYICGASSAFLGLIGAGLGIGGLFGQGKPRAAAIAGLVMGALGVCMFLAFLSAVAGG
jgi:hypothetical protein